MGVHVCPAVRLCEPTSHSRSQPTFSRGHSQTAVAPQGPPAWVGRHHVMETSISASQKQSRKGRESWLCQRPRWPRESSLPKSRMRKPSQIWALTEPPANARVPPPPLQHPAARTQGGLELQGPGQRQARESKASAWQNENHFLHQGSGLFCESSYFLNSGNRFRYVRHATQAMATCGGPAWARQPLA